MVVLSKQTPFPWCVLYHAPTSSTPLTRTPSRAAPFRDRGPAAKEAREKREKEEREKVTPAVRMEGVVAA